MNRSPGRPFVFACLIAGALALFASGHAWAAPQALAIEDFTNETGEASFDWLEFGLPEALAECVWQSPGVARAPATDCEPKPNAKFWVYRMTEAEKALRLKPPPEDVREVLDELVVWLTGEPDPLDFPASPEMVLTGSVRKGTDGLEITFALAAASGETVKEVRLTAPVEQAITTVPAEAASRLRSVLTRTPEAAADARPSLGTESAEAAQAYLEACSALRAAAVEFLRRAAEESELSDKAGAEEGNAESQEGLLDSLHSGREYAITHLKRAAAVDEGFALPHTKLAGLYLQKAEFPRVGIVDPQAVTAGREEYEAAVRLGDRSPTAMTGLAGALFMETQLALSAGDRKKGNALWDRSIEAWINAVGAEPDGASVRRSAANAYLARAIGMADTERPRIVDREAFEAGLMLLREAVKLAPECEEARERLRYVESLQAQ